MCADILSDTDLDKLFQSIIRSELVLMTHIHSRQGCMFLCSLLSGLPQLKCSMTPGWQHKRGKQQGERHTKGSPCQGLTFIPSPRDTERFHLRSLLLHIRGATSYCHLKTVPGQETETFQAACKLHNLLEDRGVGTGLAGLAAAGPIFRPKSKVGSTFGHSHKFPLCICWCMRCW